MQNIEIVSFGQIQHLLPDDCWAKSRNNLKREYDNEKVIYIQGDARVSALDLDNLSSITAGKLSDDTWIFLIFLEGNLTVDSWIGNNDTDGAPGIIVKGHLRTKNAILGGQQVYVCGDMVVDEFFGANITMVI
ncbi:hypothetical protein [Agrobacterium rubi]|uniref:Uncharacterized protein n=1 Tax=Agrobacterium rubi TaxID=28099 RepID=A0AAE7R722_9HYPH|nr:hypothetical protein [Agrobacterium rubi]NTE87493.1 hypothetical protein [Agrobacterium rubi]NTF03347.1 hypothetical protein [Agrobacterium rubi]NTF37507.1 hypothetical protein [Agrobacterium rubi]OCJ53418.1 hypothetical protein A6U92_24105 [Agrobacterium rubi]QTG02446.1 hypothetical protein G6M88_18785 [Agrobacterium rubi]